MALIYFSSSSSLAEAYSRNISVHCKSYLESECIVRDGELSQQRIRAHIEASDVMIVVICADPPGSEIDISSYNLIDNERVRSEIILAMSQDILIVPILIDDVKLPEKNNLPGALKKLINCKSHRLRIAFWSQDIEPFLEHLEEELDFLNEVRQKLTQEVEVNYQSLEGFDGSWPWQDQMDLESSNGMELRKVVEAETVFLERARGIGDVTAEKKALSALGLAYARLGQTLKAIKYFFLELKISRELGKFEEVCGLLANLGDAYAVSGNISQAQNYYEEQRELAESKGLHAYVGSSYNGLGYVCVKQKKIEQAIEYYLQALESYRLLEDHDKQLELLVGLGLNWRKLGQWEKTTEYFIQALDVAKYIENRKEEAQIRIDLVESYFKLGKKDLANFHLMETWQSEKGLS
ncbi:MAG: tetratricopeptide repeat protein [Nitrospinaceae bacterium]